jgi:hypothetical protein
MRPAAGIYNGLLTAPVLWGVIFGAVYWLTH